MIRPTIARVSLATATIALTLGLAARAEPQSAPTAAASTQAAPAGQTAGEKYKNIQLLKAMPAEQLPNAMQYIAASLGVQCGFCHVMGPDGWHFDSDDRQPKATARKMIQMVNSINSGNNLNISCASCHHGRMVPERTPPLAVELTPEQAARAGQGRQGGGPGREGPPAGGRGAQGPGGPGTAGGPAGGRGPRPTETVDQVIEKYVQAVGGSSAWGQARTLVAQGTATGRDLQSSTIKVQQKVSGEYRLDTQAGQGTMVRAYDGKGAWMMQGANARDLEGVQAQQASRLADFGLPVQLKTRYTELTADRYATTDGMNAIVLSGRTSADVTEQLFFDRGSGLLVRRVITTRTPLGGLPEQVDYSDYRDVSGIKVPFTVRYATWNQVSTQKFSDVKLNAPIDDSQFVKK